MSWELFDMKSANKPAYRQMHVIFDLIIHRKQTFLKFIAANDTPY
jgi:hypothetical protein